MKCPSKVLTLLEKLALGGVNSLQANIIVSSCFSWYLISCCFFSNFSLLCFLGHC